MYELDWLRKVGVKPTYIHYDVVKAYRVNKSEYKRIFEIYEHNNIYDIFIYDKKKIYDVYNYKIKELLKNHYSKDIYIWSINSNDLFLTINKVNNTIYLGTENWSRYRAGLCKSIYEFFSTKYIVKINLF